MGKFIDETGNRYGSRVVLKRVGHYRTNITWLVRCDCGREDTVTRGSLKLSGKCLSCWRIGRYPDETGNRYGSRVVLEYAATNRHGNTMLRVRCDCGRENTVTRVELIGGRASKCFSCAKVTIPKGIGGFRWRIETPRGYVMAQNTRHLLANTSGSLLQHWYVYGEHIGVGRARKLKDMKCTLHHINGVRDDNRIENLELRLPGQHPQGWTIEAMVETLETMGHTVDRLGGFPAGTMKWRQQ